MEQLAENSWMERQDEEYPSNAKKWTDGDMERCFEAGQCIGLSYLPHSYNEKFHEYIESLSPRLTPIDFEPEYEHYPDESDSYGESYRSKSSKKYLKIVNNILQGSYKF